MNILFLSFLAILFWFFQKIADGHNEHGLDWFPYAWMVFWIVWWAIGFYLVETSSILLSSYVALVFYWIYKMKIDYVNHAIALIIILIGMLLSKDHIDLTIVLFSLSGYILLDFMKRSFSLKTHFFFRHYLQFVFVPIICALYVQNIVWMVIVFGIVGVFLANYLFDIKPWSKPSLNK